MGYLHVIGVREIHGSCLSTPSWHATYLIIKDLVAYTYIEVFFGLKLISLSFLFLSWKYVIGIVLVSTAMFSNQSFNLRPKVH